VVLLIVTLELETLELETLEGEALKKTTPSKGDGTRSGS
jgi:hypothetical protein